MKLCPSEYWGFICLTIYLPQYQIHHNYGQEKYAIWGIFHGPLYCIILKWITCPLISSFLNSKYLKIISNYESALSKNPKHSWNQHLSHLSKCMKLIGFLLLWINFLLLRYIDYKTSISNALGFCGLQCIMDCDCPGICASF